MGLVVLVCIITLLLTARIAIRFWIKPHADVHQEKLAAAWVAFRANSMRDTVNRNVVSADADIVAADVKPVLFIFDPNTLDSAGFRKLGLREKTTSNLMKWRAKGKRFYASPSL